MPFGQSAVSRTASTVSPVVVVEAQHGRQGAPRMPGPVAADLAEHPMFDRVPFGGSAGVVADGDGQVRVIGQLLLEKRDVLKSDGVLCQGIAARYAFMKAWR